MRQRLAGVAVDITPLRRSRDFRYLYAGTAVGQIGSAFTTVAVPYQIYDLTGSTLAIGVFGAVTLVPLLVLNVVGGAIADKVERRRWIVGPALAGVVLASVGTTWAYAVDDSTFVVTVCIIVWGLAIAAFGLVDGVVLSLLALAAVGGAADMISGISRQAILQLASPPEFVGRMEGVGMAIWSGGPRLGDLRAGSVASFTSVNFAIVSGGLGCVVVMLVLARALPGFARYRAPRDDAPDGAGASITV